MSNEEKIAELIRSRQDVLDKIKAVEDDPKSLQDGKYKSIFKYNRRAQVKLDKLRRHVASITREMRLLRGKPVNDAGYSGRNSNKR